MTTTPTLLPICKATGVTLFYDVRYHRCNPDDLSVEQAKNEALATWDREPLSHIFPARLKAGTAQSQNATTTLFIV